MNSELPSHQPTPAPEPLSQPQESAPSPIDPQLLALLRCPQSGRHVIPASLDQVNQINVAIESGTCRDASGDLIHDPIEGGLISECGTWMYPIRDAIPTMIAEESIKLL